MNREAEECFQNAADMLQKATGCPPAMAAQIVTSIALGSIRWAAELENTKGVR